ncbi:unnamed protein product [Phytomonas sp. EM1]|nr:unnamed protein product [Phytomonas sp. EM1]|eukprot:CCW65756.1 unnamed protein product [Phytomonas sp. isolate EM1]
MKLIFPLFSLSLFFSLQLIVLELRPPSPTFIHIHKPKIQHR